MQLRSIAALSAALVLGASCSAGNEEKQRATAFAACAADDDCAHGLSCARHGAIAGHCARPCSADGQCTALYGDGHACVDALCVQLCGAYRFCNGTAPPAIACGGDLSCRGESTLLASGATIYDCPSLCASATWGDHAREMGAWFPAENDVDAGPESDASSGLPRGASCASDASCLERFCHPELMTCGRGDEGAPCEQDDWCSLGLICHDQKCSLALCTPGESVCAGPFAQKVCEQRGTVWTTMDCSEQLCGPDGTCVPEVQVSYCEGYRDERNLHTKLAFYQVREDRTLASFGARLVPPNAAVTWLFYESTDAVEYKLVKSVSDDSGAGKVAPQLPLKAGRYYAFGVGPNAAVLGVDCNTGSVVDPAFATVLGYMSTWWTRAPGGPVGIDVRPVMTNPDFSLDYPRYTFDITVSR